jgi:phospholipid/cholesterol/gamma-HCH transport system substrate-binding protein
MMHGLEARARTESREEGSAVTRVVAVVALAAAAVLVVLTLFGNGNGHSYSLIFQTGGQLVPGNQVLVAGQAVGTVDEIDLTDSAEAEVKVTLDRPLHEGTTAQIRLTSLSGIANRYVALHMGPDSAPELPEGATLAADETTSPVDLDQLFDLFDDPTRKALRNVIQGQATIYGGAEQEANRAYKFLAPGLDSTRRLLAELNRDQRAFERFLISGSRVLGAVAERRTDLSELTSNANQALAAIAAENAALDRTLGALPPAMRQANTTFVNLRAALDDLDPLIATTGRSTEDLAPFLRELRPVAQKAVPVVGDLSRVFSRDGDRNDLVDALRALPRTNRIAGAAVPRAIAAMNQTQDEIEVLRPYSPDLLGWLAGLGQAGATYDANGHYVRVQPAGANLFTWDDPTDGDADGDGITSDLIPIPPADQLADYQDPVFGTGPFMRCPGASTQAIPLSNPFDDDGALAGICDPTQVPPG